MSNNPLNKVSRANDTISNAISTAESKKEFIAKQLMNGVLLFIILAVFGCLDFATLTFHFEYLGQASYWATVMSKVIAGICAFNIGINIMWDTELFKDKILEVAVGTYNYLKVFMNDNFEYYVTHVFNPTEKAKAYVSQINKKIYILNKHSRAYDRLLYSSDLPERQNEKKKNKYCIWRQQLEDLKDPEFIKKNIDSLKVKYNEVDPTVFSLEIDGSPATHGVKTKGSVTAGRVKASANVVLGMVGFSMFFTAIGLQLDKQQFESQMDAFLHYLMKCATDVGIVLWQLTRGMLKVRKIISSELTQPYAGRNKVLLSYLKWELSQGILPQADYDNINKHIKQIESKALNVDVNMDTEQVIEMTEEEYRKYEKDNQFNKDK